MLTPPERARHIRETFIRLGDEFLVQYFLCAHKEFRHNQILSRLFAMGHSLELYLKAALAQEDGSFPATHDVPSLLTQFDPTLTLSAVEIKAGETLFASDVTNVDLGLWMQHQDALELYQAQYFVKDLKYYLNRNGDVIYPAVMSLRPINPRYLSLVKAVRTAVRQRPPQQDQELVALVAQLGFETNPAMAVL